MQVEKRTRYRVLRTYLRLQLYARAEAVYIVLTEYQYDSNRDAEKIMIRWPQILPQAYNCEARVDDGFPLADLTNELRTTPNMLMTAENMKAH